jgi:hypothetical protein
MAQIHITFYSPTGYFKVFFLNIYTFQRWEARKLLELLILKNLGKHQYIPVALYAKSTCIPSLK